MSVGEVCNREVVVIDAEASVLEAAHLMREFHVGDVVVVEQRRGMRVPKGILTDRDIVLEIVAKEIDPAAVSCGDAMSYDLRLVSESDDLLDAMEQMRSRGVRRLPVVDDDGALAGILAVDDLIELAAEQLTDLVALIARERQREERLRH